MKDARQAFTLIELLIVIAIIAILALIAIPNFIEAQTRAKVSRAHADMRTVATALESYFVDNNAYPLADWRGVYDHSAGMFAKHLWRECDYPGGASPNAQVPVLTTPVAYLSSTPPVDPFHGDYNALTPVCRNNSYFYYNFLGAATHRTIWSAQWTSYDGVVAPAPMRFNGEDGKTKYANWAMFSFGPDRDWRAPAGCHLFLSHENGWNAMVEGKTHVYDPTNGTVSMGNIWRLSGGAD